MRALKGHGFSRPKARSMTNRGVSPGPRMRILPTWLREFVNVTADDRQLAEDLTSAGIAVESIAEENGETIYEMDLTTNRVDAMNHYGVAREASAIYGVELKPVQPMLPGGTAGPSAPLGMTQQRAGSPLMTAGEGSFLIVIEDADGCARYTGRVIRNVKIGPSPAHIVKRLELLGSRAINNAADATNYAINELGHPTHAFDLDLLEGGTIIVRRAREGETLKTLDGVERKLSDRRPGHCRREEAGRAGGRDGRLRLDDHREDQERADRVSVVRPCDHPPDLQTSFHAHRRVAPLRARSRLGYHTAGLRSRGRADPRISRRRTRRRAYRCCRPLP